MGESPEERIAVLESRFDGFDTRLEHIEEGMDKLVGWANRWKGGFAVLLGVGALIGWFADKFWDFITRGH